MQRKASSSALFNTVGKGPTGVIKSVLETQRTDGGRRDEIFVDIVERISCTFNQTGYVTASQIDGAIQVCICCLDPTAPCTRGSVLVLAVTVAKYRHIDHEVDYTQASGAKPHLYCGRISLQIW